MTDPLLKRYEHLLRNDFAAFAHRSFLELNRAEPFERNWHIDAIAEKFEAILRGQSNRLIVNLPPRSLKSFLGSIVLPAFWLGHNPGKKVMCISYGQVVANELAGQCRMLMESPFYKALFPTRVSPDSRALEKFETTDRGARLAVSPDGPVTGRGADLLIIDDLVKAHEAETELQRAATNFAYDMVISQRVNRGDAPIVLIMHRVHAHDLTAFVQKEENWDLLALPALATDNEIYRIKTPYGRRIQTRAAGEALQPLRFSRDQLLVVQKRNPTVFDAQHQQHPRASGSRIIDPAWLVYDDARPETFDLKLQSWDTAGAPGDANSYNVCTTWGIRNGHYYLIDCLRERMKYEELAACAVALAQNKDLGVILVEAANWGQPLVNHLKDKGFNARAEPSTNASKQARLISQINRFSDRQVHLPTTASWLKVYVEEMTAFPDTEYNDQVDSTSQALAYNSSGSNADNAIAAMHMIAGGGAKSCEMLRVKPRPGQETTNLEFAERDPYTVYHYTPEADGAFLLPEKWALICISKGWIKLE